MTDKEKLDLIAKIADADRNMNLFDKGKERAAYSEAIIDAIMAVCETEVKE